MLYAPWLQWYVDHGAVITKAYWTINYKPKQIVTFFIKQVTKAQCTVDADKSKALLLAVG